MGDAHSRDRGTGPARLDQAAGANEKSRPARHARVLVVDDNAVNQKVARMMLERLGCRVDVAANGQEAVTLAGSLPYDVVFMDCEMPLLDGFAATAAIRQGQAPGQHINIVAMTARACRASVSACLRGDG